MAKTKLTYELIETMAELKGKGLSNKDVCAAVGISEQTLYRWLRKPSTKLHRSLCESLKKAEAARKEALLQRIYDASEKPQSWTAAAWLLERQYPDEFGRVDRRREEPKQADVPQIVLGVVVGKSDGDSPGDDDG